MDWVAGVDGSPRRAAVSAFGFGGTNFHCVLEESASTPVEAPADRWAAELLLWAAKSRAELPVLLGLIDDQLARGAKPELRHLAAALWRFPFLKL